MDDLIQNAIVQISVYYESCDKTKDTPSWVEGELIAGVASWYNPSLTLAILIIFNESWCWMNIEKWKSII